MKKRIFKILIFVIIAVLIYGFFHIDGWRIKNTKNLLDASFVEVYVHNENTGEEIEYALNAEQRKLLSDLLIESSYTRRLSSTIIGALPDKRYTVLADWNDNGQTNLYVNTIGGEYIRISGQFGSGYLKINNKDFEENLKALLEK